MWIWKREDWISWNDCTTRKDLHGPSETQRNLRLAYPNISQTSQIIPRIWEFLSTIHSKVCWLDSTSEWSVEKGYKIWMDPRMPRFIWYPEKEIHWRTSTHDAQSVKTFPDWSQHIQVCNRSSFDTNNSNSDRHPVAFILRTLSPTKRNYEIYDQELLSIIRALEEWQHYIQRSGFMTKILSDHKNLTYFRKAQKLNRWQA